MQSLFIRRQKLMFLRKSKKSTTKHFLLIFVLLLFLHLIQTVPCSAYDVTVRVALLMNQQAINITCSRGLIIKNANTLDEITRVPSRIVIRTDGNSLLVNDKRVDAKMLYVMTTDFRTPISLNDVPYRGYYMVALNENRNIIVVNHVGLEDYLGGVLGGEIAASWPLESIKAQAVAARTYALHRMNVKKHALYDVTNDTRDQMYLGIRGEADAFTRAIRETRSQVLVKNGEIICAFYHSNCGGGTADSNTVFNTGDRSFAGTRDPHCAGAPNSSWTIRLKADEIRSSLSKEHKIGKIFSITSESRDNSGRNANIKIEHEWGTTVMPGHEFRKHLGFQKIRSTRFQIEPQHYFSYRYTKKIAADRMGINTFQSNGIDKTGEGLTVTEEKKISSDYVFTGSGWGHGVGLCQWGARGAALKGYNYRQILSHYYPGIELCVVQGKN
jgi:stage II sporulation protein D